MVPLKLFIYPIYVPTYLVERISSLKVGLTTLNKAILLQVIGSSSNSSRNHGSNRSQTNRQSSSAKSDSKPSGGGYSKSRSKGDRRSMSAGARNSPKQNRPASIPPPPVVSENQGEVRTWNGSSVYT